MLLWPRHSDANENDEIDDCRCRPYVLPGRYVLPLVAPEDMDMQPPKGVLFVTLIAATDVRARAIRPGGFASSFFHLLVLSVSQPLVYGQRATRPGGLAPCLLASGCKAA